MTNHLPSSELVIRPASFSDIPHIQQIAFDTWPLAYGSILSNEQLQYMLDKFYSASSLQKQMEEHHYFFLALLDYKPVGFAAFSKTEATIYKLHKLYVLPGTQKGGLGLALMTIVEETAKSLGGTHLQLNVNRHNKAKIFYEKHGFALIREEDIDIGSGYYMNDFIMEKQLG